MGIMTRMLRLCRADVHGVMDQLEDKGLLLKQYLREMESSLEIKEQQVRTLTIGISRLNGRVAAHREETDKLEQDLTLALNKEKDEIARMLIRKRRTLAAAIVHLNRQVEAMTGEREQLAESLAEQRLQYETLKVKADAYGQRAGEGLSDSGVESGLEDWAATGIQEAEIELELLQRKEALRKGDTP